MKHIILLLLALASIAFAQQRSLIDRKGSSRLDQKTPDTEAVNPHRDEVVGLWHAEGSRGWRGPIHLLPNGNIASGGTWRVRGNKLICDYGGGKADVFDLPAKDGVITGMSFRGTTMRATKQPSPGNPVKPE